MFNNSLKKSSVKLLFLLCFLLNVFGNKTWGQQQKAIVNIDSVNVVFDGSLSFPYWLKAGQVVKPSDQIAALSVLEFKVDSASGNLTFYQVLSIKSRAVVPVNKSWKIESLTLIPSTTATTKPAIMTSPARFTTPGTYTWIVPVGVYNICVEVWGGGGGGAKTSSSFGGGSGGGYGYECFNVLPGTSYTVQVAGSGGTSYVGSLISASGGKGGSTSGDVTGGTSGAKFNITGSSSRGLDGGAGANGGAGGLGNGLCGNPGNAPGGGGGACGSSCGTPNTSGTPGQVIIHW